MRLLAGGNDRIRGEKTSGATPRFPEKESLQFPLTRGLAGKAFLLWSTLGTVYFYSKRVHSDLERGGGNLSTTNRHPQERDSVYCSGRDDRGNRGQKVGWEKG